MKSRFLYLILYICLLPLAGCNVHEWPDLPENVQVHLQLRYDTDMTEWGHLYDGYSIIEHHTGPTESNVVGYGVIRYIIRAYPVSGRQRNTLEYSQEFVFTKNVSEGYDHDVTVELPAGDYNLMVWSDLVETSGNPYYHNANNFAEIFLQGKHQGNTDHRDAFRGTMNVKLETGFVEHAPDTYEILMQRPLAKFEFITTDLQEFIDKEIELLQKEAASRGEEPPTRVETENYRVVFYYSGYMPNTYNMYTDKPIDSATGIWFESRLNELSNQEASLGFDYVFVNGKESGVTVQIGLYNQEDEQLSLTDPVNVPLRRNHHTILRGSFLMLDASGGITINPDFDGNHNIIIE